MFWLSSALIAVLAAWAACALRDHPDYGLALALVATLAVADAVGALLILG